jgi:hypothetical protein
MRNKIDFKTLEKINETFGSFDIGQVMGGGNPVYFRFGYWNKIDVQKLQEIIGHGNEVVENDIYDDDCGFQYSYLIK